MNFLSYDSPFMRSLRQVFDYVCLGLLWVAVSMPIITFGVSTTAMLITAEKSIKKATGHIWSTFWHYFASEFKQATILWLLAIALLLALILNILLMYNSTAPTYIKILLFLVTAGFFSWIHMWFGYLSKFQDKTRILLHNTLIITLSNLYKCLLLDILSIFTVFGAIVLFFSSPPFLLLLPGVYIILASYLHRWIFKKYQPSVTAEVADDVETE